MPTLHELTLRHGFPIARALLSLPNGVLRALSGGRYERDGASLDPQMQILVALRARTGGGPLGGAGPEVARRGFHDETIAFAGPPIAIGAVTDRTIDGPGGRLRVRHYVPKNAGRALPLLVFAHGGGFVIGDLDTHDSVCRTLCRDADVHVLAVDYRLSPEHKCPAAIDDFVAAFRWAVANADTLGVDPKRVGLGGDSAGGNLTAVASQRLAREAIPPFFQLLIYPPCDRVTPFPSLALFGEGLVLTRADIDWFDAQYTGGSGIPADDPTRSPIFARDLSGLPPAFIVTAGFDPLRDEGEAYARALEGAGNTVKCRRFDGMIHGFVSMTAVSSSARAAVREIADGLRSLAYRR
jgi:acetyl esterase